MKKIFFLILLFLFAFVVNSVNAHIRKSDNSVESILHIEPNDEVVAKQESDIRLLFTQMPADFGPKNWNCTVEIYFQERVVYNQNIFANNSEGLENVHFNFIFPEIGIYKIKVTGKPINDDSSKQFTLEYNLRVEKSAKNSLLTLYSPQITLIMVFTVSLCFSAIILFKFLANAKKNSH